MWLLDVRTYELRDFIMNWSSYGRPLYTILSHTWEKEEVLFKDMSNLVEARKKAGWKKIEYMCQQTVKDGYDWTWIDTCCIDKSSSAELSEAINSMFKWYREAEVCHVYLSDVDVRHGIIGYSRRRLWEYSEGERPFRTSRWWSRGWTLQELLAPEIVQFWDLEWNRFGSLVELVEQVSIITTIEVDILLQKKSYKDEPVAKRFSWAAGRNTTRSEDVAYSLLGILNVNMPILYGEGHKAFGRLQEEFMKSSADLSILLWDPPHANLQTGALAEGPRDFAYWSKMRSYGWTISHRSVSIQSFALTNAGLRVDLPCAPFCELSESAKTFMGSWGSQSSYLLADMCTSMVSKSTLDGYSVYLILEPAADCEPTAHGQNTSYQVAPFFDTRNLEQFCDRIGRNRARLALLPSAEIVPTTMKQLYLKSTKQQAPDLLLRKTALRMELSVGARVTDALPAGSWHEGTSILTTQPVYKDGKVALRRRAAVIRLDFNGLSCCLCFHWSTDGLRWGFLPQYSLEEAYKWTLEHEALCHNPFSHPIEEEIERCYECIAVKRKVVTIGRRAATSTNFLVVRALTAGECSDHQTRWARDPVSYAPFDLKTETLYFNRQLRNKLATEELVRNEAQPWTGNFAPY